MAGDGGETIARLYDVRFQVVIVAGVDRTTVAILGRSRPAAANDGDTIWKTGRAPVVPGQKPKDKGDVKGTKKDPGFLRSTSSSSTACHRAATWTSSRRGGGLAARRPVGAASTSPKAAEVGSVVSGAVASIVLMSESRLGARGNSARDSANVVDDNEDSFIFPSGKVTPGNDIGGLHPQWKRTPQANEQIRGQEAHLEGAVNPSHVTEVPVGTAPVGEKVPASLDFPAEFPPVEGSHEEEVGPALTFKQTEPPKFKLDTSQLNFDPFQMLQRPPTKIKEANDWPGAPFVVSPPKLPVVMNGKAEGAQHPADGDGGGVRLGYFQNPTVVDGTVVFSSEGDLYLTRLAEMELQNMPAMKLTTTLGNALHPKLNPLYPHLLVYSATYSGVREVYLMDLRLHTNGLLGTPLGAPGYPGGPALRLTYTPGGIVGVVGWDEDGTSVLYSAEGQDARALPDVRLFRLRLSWGQHGVGLESFGGREEVEDEGGEDEATSKGPKKTVMKGEDKEATVRGEGPREEKKQGKEAAGVKKGNDGASEPQEWEDDDNDDDDRLSIEKDTQEYVNTSPNKVTRIAAAKRGQNHGGKGRHH